MKTILVAVLVVLSSLQLCRAQELSLDLTVFASQLEPRFQDEYWSNRGNFNFGLSYLDSLSKKFDYKIGLAYQGGLESYFNIAEVDRFVSGDTITVSITLMDRFNSNYLSARLGVKYWFTANRKGFYLVSELLPHYLVASSRKKEEIGADQFVFSTKSDPSDTYTSFNVVWLNGAGYRLVVGYGLSIHASLHLVTTIGNVVVGVSNGNRIWRGLNLGATYKL